MKSKSSLSFKIQNILYCLLRKITLTVLLTTLVITLYKHPLYAAVDLVVSSITFSDDNPIRGENIQIYAEITNEGGTATTNTPDFYEDTGASNEEWRIDTGQQCAQSFKVNAKMQLQTISIYCYDCGSTTGDTITMELRSDSSGQPGGILTSAPSSGGTTPHWEDFSISYELEANTVYWLVASNGQSSNEGWKWIYEEVNGYPDGDFACKMFGSWYTSGGAAEALFRVTGKPISVRFQDGGVQVGSIQYLSNPLVSLAVDSSTETWNASPGGNHTISITVAYAGDEPTTSNNETNTIFYVSQSPPANISNLTALTHATVNGAVTLEWTAPGEDQTRGTVSQYELKHAGYGLATTGMITNGNYSGAATYDFAWDTTTFQSAGNKESITVTGLTRGATYWFALKARDGDTPQRWNVWNSSADASNINTLCSAEAYDEVPPAPTVLVSTVGSSGVAEVFLEWQQPASMPDDFLFYRVYCDSTDPYNWQDQFVVTETVDTHCTHSSLSYFNTYYYHVVTVDEGPKFVESSYSNTTSTCSIPPYAPAGFAGTGISTGSINWAWTDTAGNELGFRVKTSTDGLLVELGVDVESWMEVNLDLNSPYSRYAEAYNLQGSSPAVAYPDLCYTLANPPTSSYVIGVTSGSVRVGWSANFNPSYTVWGIIHSTDNFVTSTSPVIQFGNGITATAYTESSLQPLTTYWYKVCAYNGDGEPTAYDVLLTTRTDPGPPVPPTNFGGTPLSTGSIHWEWTDNSDGGYRELGYRVKTDTGGIRAELSVNTTFWSEFSLGLNAPYTRYSEAYNEVGYTVSNSSMRYTLASPPTGSYLVDVTPYTIDLDWGSNYNPGYTRWGLVRSKNNFATSTTTILDFSDAQTGTSYSDTGLAPETTYWYKVCGYNGDSIPTAFDVLIVTVTLQAPATAPINFSGEALSESSIHWTWEDQSDNESGFRVVTDTGGIRKDLSQNVTFWTETALSVNTEYTRYCEAYNLTGSSASNVDMKYTLARPPTSTYVLNVGAYTAGLEWYPNLDPGWTAWGILQSTDNFNLNVSTALQFSDNIVSTTHTVTGLQPLTTYWFMVRAYNGNGIPTTFDIVVETTTLKGAPDAPLDFIGVALSTGSILWSWVDNSSDEDGFRVMSDANDVLVELSADVTWWIETDLEVNTAYNRHCDAFSLSGSSSSNSDVCYTFAKPPVDSYIISRGTTSIKLGWSKGENPDGTFWGVKYSLDKDNFSYITVVDYLSTYTELTLTHIDLFPGATYYYKVQAYNGDGIETEYDVMVETCTIGVPPRAPSDFVGVALSTTSIYWSWTDNAKYELGFSLKSDKGELIASLAINASYYIETDLKVDTAYRRYVESYNYAGSSVSNSDVRYTLANPPYNAQITSATYHKLLIQWDDTQSTRLKINYSSTSLTSSDIHTKSWANNVSTSPYWLDGLHLNNPYYLELWAYNGDQILTSSSVFVNGSTLDLPASITKMYSNLGGKQTVDKLINGVTVQLSLDVPANAVGKNAYALINTNAMQSPEVESLINIIAANAQILEEDMFLIEDSVAEFNMYDFVGTSITTFATYATITLGYPDADNDGIVDDAINNTKVREEVLAVAMLDSNLQEWVHLTNSIVAEDDNYVSCDLSHLSLYAIVSLGPEYGKTTRIYPNPFKPNSNLGHTTIYFDRLEVGSDLRVYDISGNLVWKAEDIQTERVEWDANNAYGRKVASGVYILLMTKGGNKKLINFAIVR
ncbi:MAG: T9SS type A sorting domain-containing protein [Endomicrobiales bacterium]|nr:T9SS type A sorting domain-containing protein [Endomicrobiales bacterium]